jgi:hypothetical protein
MKKPTMLSRATACSMATASYSIGVNHPIPISRHGITTTALQPWHGIITLEIGKLSTLKDLHKSILKILFLSLRIWLDSALSVLRQRRLQVLGKDLPRARDSDISRR